MHAPNTLANNKPGGVIKTGIKFLVIVWLSPKIDVAVKAAIIASSLLFT